MAAELDVGAVIRRVLDIYVEQASVLMPAAAVVFAFTGILVSVLISVSPGLALLAAAIYLCAVTLFAGMVVHLVADIQDGRRDATARQLLASTAPVFGQLLLVGLVVTIGLMAGFLLLVIPGLILMTIWAVAVPVVVLERPGVFASLSRSRGLVRGNGPRVFAVLLVLVVFVLVAGNVLDRLAMSLGTATGIVVTVIVGVLSAPLSALAASVLYFDLRARTAAQ